MTLRAVLALVFTVGLLAVPSLAPAQGQPTQQGEFVPIDQLPPQEQLPAAPLLVSAYVFVLVAVMLYLFSLGKRLSAVHREVVRLDGELKRGWRGSH